MSFPLVTVYIPTYNRKDLLNRAIDSVVGQTYKNIEIIVVDDNSNDGTQLFLENKIKTVPNLKYFIKNVNSGACVSRNIAIENATGDFITGLDDDDYFLPNRVSDFVNCWNVKKSDITFLYSSYTQKFDSNNFVRRKLRKQTIKFDDLVKINDIGNQIFIKTEVFRKYKFDERMPMWQDFKCWLDILYSENKAFGINNYSYVIDKSHDHERISNKKLDSLIKAENIIKKEFNLDFYQILYLSNQKSNYNRLYKISLKKLIFILLKVDLDFKFKLRIIKQYIK